MQYFTHAILGSMMLLVITACTGANQPSQSSTKIECTTKNWAGWAYIENVGDFPFRVRANADNLGSMDISAANLFEAPLIDMVYQYRSLSFTWITNNGERRIFSGREQDLLINGTITWGEASGTFTLNCAALPISARNTEASGVKSAYYLCSG